MGGHDLNGIVVIDKPADLSSARVVAIVKKLLGARKAGHTGTLDPFATGVMVCCMNRATKLARFFIEGWKTYTAVLHLGIETDTQDATGTIVSRSETVDFPEDLIRSVINGFEGQYAQVPPAYSALKHKGVPLYKLARCGQPVKKPARDVHISRIRVLDIHLPFVHFSVTCSSGTYVRSIGADIGSVLGCGGHLQSLRRTACSGFTIEDAICLPDLETLAARGRATERIIEMTHALKQMPKHLADNGLIKKLMNGKMITENDIRPDAMGLSADFIQLVDDADALLAVLARPKENGIYRYMVNFTA